MARYDKELQIKSAESLPDESADVLMELLRSYPEKDQVEILKQHLAALPGWIGYIK